MAVAKAKAKKKRRTEIQEIMSPAAQKKAERKIERAVGDMDELADSRYEYAQAILAVNDGPVREIVEHMAETMGKMAGEPRLKVDGIFVNYDPEILRRINYKLHVWIAVRLLVAAALWDVRISGFTLPEKQCARCGKVTRRKR